MEHPSHEHPLILNVDHIAREGDVCRACNQQIVSCKSSVYSCSRSSSSITNATGDDSNMAEDKNFLNFLFGRSSTISVSCAEFFLHKSCAELPAYIRNPINPKNFLKICFNHSRDTIESKIFGQNQVVDSCNICGIKLPWQVKQFFYYISNTDMYVCLKCALFQLQHSLEDRKLEHPAHSQHSLAIIQRPSSFICDACKVEDNNKDSSYICTKCQFWVHKSCADAPPTFHFQFHHQHPLVLSFSLPRVYHKFIQYCRLCKDTLNHMDWLYYCRYCRYFAHFHCARSRHMSCSSEDETLNSDLVHLPAADELSAIILAEQFIKGMSAQCDNNNDDNSNNILSSANSIKHWAHDGHDLQLMTVNDFQYEKDNNKTILQCDGCVKLIRTDDHHQFYGCVPCKYFLHTFCAELPEEIEHYYPSSGRMFYAQRDSEKFKIFQCIGCGFLGNGIFFSSRGIHPDLTPFRVHIGCATLPQMIKHEAHPHKLNLVIRSSLFSRFQCQACGRTFDIGSFHVCEECEMSLCGGCIMKPRTVNHPWDPHSMQLIYEPGMVGDHEHDFNCEYCSEDIDPNFWFYHCSECDFSFHLQTCFERSRHNEYSNIKFGATDIIIDKLHPHGLTFVLNKKVRSCGKCHQKLLGKPVLECPAAPCKAVFCTDCSMAARRGFYTVGS